jgi:hypothetical protein
MNGFKRGAAAMGLVLSLGLIAPSSFGGSVSADVSPNNPNSFMTTLTCTIGGEKIVYEVVTTGSAASFQDLNSSTTFVVSYAVEHRVYTVKEPAPGGGEDVGDVFELDTSFGPGWPKAKKNGHQDQLRECVGETDEFDTVGDGDPGEVIGTLYRVEETVTWWVKVSGNRQGAVAAASVDDQAVDRQSNSKSKKAKHKRGKGKRGR